MNHFEEWFLAGKTSENQFSIKIKNSLTFLLFSCKRTQICFCAKMNFIHSSCKSFFLKSRDHRSRIKLLMTSFLFFCKIWFMDLRTKGKTF